jgi:hypothetical protein
MKKIGIGRSDYKTLIENNCYYIDKTPSIIEWFESGSLVTLMPRPRRFGKTLFLSTIFSFFSLDERDEEIYKETSIYNTPFFEEHFGKYPVIFLTFKDIKRDSFEETYQQVVDIIMNELYKYKNIDFSKLSNLDKEIEIFNNIVNKNYTKTDILDSLRALSRILYHYFKKQVIILIDEYDTPIQSAYLNGFYDDAINLFKNLLGGILKDNDRYVKKALLTGILRISQESMFSDLNNLNVDTILDNELKESCGFTIEEAKQFLSYYNFNEKEIQQAIDWYNGYIFGDDTIILNPWSLLNYAYKRNFDAYWANTSSNEFIRHLVKNSKSFQENLEKLLDSEEIDIKVNKHLTFKDNELYQKDNLFSFLFFSGYLKCKEKYKEKIEDEEFLHCKMIPTNIECKTIFREIISKYVMDTFKNPLDDVLESLLSGNIKLFEKLFSYLLRDTVSYHDTRTENSYHMFLLGLLTTISGKYEIISNSEAGYGRVDIILLHKTDKTKPAIVMELKVIDTFEEEDKEKALKKAVNQIIEKDYISYVQKRGYENIKAFGLVFDGKRCWIKEVK